VATQVWPWSAHTADAQRIVAAWQIRVQIVDAIGLVEHHVGVHVARVVSCRPSHATAMAALEDGAIRADQVA